MKKNEILKSIETYREMYDSLLTNRPLPNEVIFNTYFSFENSRYLGKKDKFEKLPQELSNYYESKGMFKLGDK